MSESPKVNFQSTQTLALNPTSVFAGKGGNGGQEVENPVISTAQQQHDHKSTYPEVVETKKISRMRLMFIPPEEVNGIAVVKYQSTGVMPGINRWKSAAYGDVMGINPNFITIEKFVCVKWREFGYEKMFKLASGLFLFQFGDDDGKDRMIEEGPWIFAQHPMILNPWTPESRLEMKGVEKIPVWLCIPYLSLKFWNEGMFSKIGSYVGTPLFADGAISYLARVSYVRLYVEITAERSYLVMCLW
ncbi:hypothetical protein LIER_13876 [Lithospermum erythrorhizon]|uniref:DUF4283 domain-containing protein n=1 Tax=Lithospermum erythrorhizon TaxID=34254 RepID=A0AAV3PYM4_LITER